YRVGDRSSRPQRGRHPADLPEEGRAGVDARVAAAGVPQLAEDARAALGQRAVRSDRLSGHQLLRGSQAAAQAGQPRAGRSQAARDVREAGYPELVRQYIGSVVPHNDNFFAALNSAVFTDGSFVYIPKGVRCPMELSTYFRINAESTGQFERTL